MIRQFKNILIFISVITMMGCASTPRVNYDFIDNWCGFLHDSGEATTKCGLETVVFVKAALGIEFYKLDGEALVVLDKIEKIYLSTDKLTSVQKAELAGLWTRFFTRLSTQAIEAIGPEIIKLLIKV